jgi:hypothetical protein
MENANIDLASSDLRRSARALIIATLVVIIFCFSNLKVEKIEFSGVSITPLNNYFPFILIIFIWLYHLLVYFQYYRRDNSNVVETIGDLAFEAKVKEFAIAKFRENHPGTTVIPIFKVSKIDPPQQYKGNYKAEISKIVDDRYDPVESVDITEAEYNREGRKAYVKIMLLRPEFREAVFPFLLSFIAIILIIWRVYEHYRWGI